MKKNYLFALLLSCATTFGALAQVDVTPSRYVFANQPEGKYKIDANSPNNWNAPPSWGALDVNGDNLYNNGFVAIAGGPDISGEHPADNPLHVAMYDGINIVDLGGDVGKCLVIQGGESKYKIGKSMGAEYKGNGFNLNLYSGSFNKDEKHSRTKFRVRVVFSIADNEPNPSASALTKMYFVTYTGNPIDHDKQSNKDFPSKFFALQENGLYVEDDDENFIYDPTIWEIFEYDIEVDDFPVRLKMEFDKNLSGSTVMIKEIKFIKNPNTALQNKTDIKYNPTKKPSGIFNPTVQTDPLRYSIYQNNVRFYDLEQGDNVRIYNLNGQEISTIEARSKEMDINLASGFYIAKSKNKVAKIVVR